MLLLLLILQPLLWQTVKTPLDNFLITCFLPIVNAQSLQTVQIYTDDRLLDLIKKNKHLSQVVIHKWKFCSFGSQRPEFESHGGHWAHIVFWHER